MGLMGRGCQIDLAAGFFLVGPPVESMSKLRVDTHVMFEGIESPRTTHGSAPMSPMPSACSAGAARPSTVEDGLLAMSAQPEDRQEARRRMAPGGKILQDNGATSDDGRQEQDYQRQRERLLSLFSPSSSVSGGISLSGAPGDDPNLPPSERYWRERASLMGGRCSVMDHVARVRERRQVQADLRAWVEDVLDGRQLQQVEDAKQQEQQQQPLSTRADTRWGDLPPDLYYKLTGQRPSATAQASIADAQAGGKHHHQRPSVRPRQSVRHSIHNAQQLIEQLAQQQNKSQQQPQHQVKLMPHMQQQQAQQQGLLAASADSTSSVAESGGGLYLTPRTAQEFGDEVRQKVQQKVDAELQQQLQQVTQQWQQASLADQQLLQQLQHEHQKMQQQLEAAHQQIAALQSGSTTSSIYTAVVAPGRRVTGLSPGSSGELHQCELLTNPAPDVQVLTFLDTDEQQGGSRCCS